MRTNSILDCLFNRMFLYVCAAVWRTIKNVYMQCMHVLRKQRREW